MRNFFFDAINILNSFPLGISILSFPSFSSNYYTFSWLDEKYFHWLITTVWKVSKYGVFSGLYFLAFGPEITPYLNTFHAVHFWIIDQIWILKARICNTVLCLFLFTFAYTEILLNWWSGQLWMNFSKDCMVNSWWLQIAWNGVTIFWTGTVIFVNCKLFSYGRWVSCFQIKCCALEVSKDFGVHNFASFLKIYTSTAA